MQVIEDQDPGDEGRDRDLLLLCSHCGNPYFSWRAVLTPVYGPMNFSEMAEQPTLLSRIYDELLECCGREKCRLIQERLARRLEIPAYERRDRRVFEQSIRKFRDAIL